MMLDWKKSINGMPPHSQSVFGWNVKGKFWIRDIWWDEQEETWNTYEEFYAKDEISHWMEHPSAPDDISDGVCLNCGQSNSYERDVWTFDIVTTDKYPSPEEIVKKKKEWYQCMKQTYAENHLCFCKIKADYVDIIE